MITYAANVLSFFAITLQNILLTASASGRIIIAVITWILSQFSKIFERVFIFFQIVYEDNLTIFTEELPNTTSGFIDTIYNQFLYLQDIIGSVYYSITDKFTAIIITLSWFVRTVAVYINEFLFLLKNAFILIGNTLLFTISFIPIQLPRLLKFLSGCISDLVIEVINKVNMNLLDLHWEAFIGLISTLITVYLVVNFRETLLTQMRVPYIKLKLKMIHLYYTAYNYFFDSEVVLLARLANSVDVGTREVNLVHSGIDELNNTDSLCIVCQEQLKCVLTLPCRHVCLCSECCKRLYGYQRTCPMCRTYIYHSIIVYL